MAGGFLTALAAPSSPPLPKVARASRLLAEKKIEKEEGKKEEVGVATISICEKGKEMGLVSRADRGNPTCRAVVVPFLLSY